SRAAPEVLPYANFPFTLAVGAMRPGDLAQAPVTDEPEPSQVPVAGRVRFREIDTGMIMGARRPKRIAVSTPRYDDVGRLLDSLGEGYRYQTLQDDDFLNPESLDPFEIVFLTCKGWPSSWGTTEGVANRPGLGYGKPYDHVVERFGETLRRFVGRGGTLYVSDLRKEVLFWGFPHRQRVGGLNLGLLPRIDTLEREWLTVVNSARKLDTIKEMLQGLTLGPDLTRDFPRLHAAIEGSPLTRGDLRNEGLALENRVREVLTNAGLTGDDDDVKALAEALKDWETSIQSALRGRSKKRIAQSQATNLALQNQLNALRDALTEDLDGDSGQQVIARVVDPGLSELLGESLPLRFNDVGWQTAHFQGKDVVEYLRGNYRATNGQEVNAPLLVKFPEGKGQVIFTSFHNEEQNSRQELELLKYLVFSAVTAQEQEAAEKSMLSGGFPPTKRSLVSHSAGAPSVTRTYQAEKEGAVRFALTFPGGGARLKLTLIAPTGQTFEKETDVPLIVEAEDAPAGEWNYTITALKVPFENFPYSLSVGERQTPPKAVP
ncbi:MAG: hypothetical protein AB7I30_06405, partial [Isosphaeraceae bacterium]